MVRYLMMIPETVLCVVEFALACDVLESSLFMLDDISHSLLQAFKVVCRDGRAWLAAARKGRQHIQSNSSHWLSLSSTRDVGADGTSVSMTNDSRRTGNSP